MPLFLALYVRVVFAVMCFFLILSCSRLVADNGDDEGTAIRLLKKVDLRCMDSRLGTTLSWCAFGFPPRPPPGLSSFHLLFSFFSRCHLVSSLLFFVSFQLGIDKEERRYLDACDRGLFVLQQVDAIIVRLVNMGNALVSRLVGIFCIFSLLVGSTLVSLL